MHPRASVSYPQERWCIHGWTRINSVAVADRLYQKLRNFLEEFCIDILMNHKSSHMYLVTMFYSINKPAEKCSCRSIKRVICLKQKHWSKSWALGTSNRCLDHLSRQFLTTASTFPYSSKNSSAEHIHALSTWLIITNTLTHLHRQTHTHTHSHRQTHTHT